MESSTVYILVAFLGTTFLFCEGGIDWSVATKICVKGKGNSPGHWVMPRSGVLRAAKLTHVGNLSSSHITCDYRRPHYKTFWGCNYRWTKGYIGILVTDEYNNILFPAPHLKRGGWYKLERKNAMSPELVLGNPFAKDALKVTAGDEVKIWYGEDLYNHGEGDNGGLTCMHASALITDE